jgi:16S rRNA (adenine1518-N6/adenine1519-N6)-dimethyltransferase
VHPREQLAGTEIRPKRSFGQNFLVDDVHRLAIARLCLEHARDRDHTVVEMGAGLGSLTEMLGTLGAAVVAVERDRDLVPKLRERFAKALTDGWLQIHEANALTFPLEDQPAGFALVGNLPYHHAAEIALRALDAWPRIGGACFLVQKEVAERMAARPGNKDFGSLSVVLQSRFDVRLARKVPKGAFWPVPEVDGGVVTLAALKEPRGAPHTREQLERVVRPAFQQRRKTLHNALKGIASDEVLRAVGIDPTARAEDVPVDAWGRLAAAPHEPG